MLLLFYVVCQKSSVNGIRKQTKQKEVHRTPLILRSRAPDQGSTVDFFLFPCVKSIMKGARFADVSAVQERVTAVLRSIPKDAFADSFRKFYERCQQCVVKDGDYFEGP
jgi:hypothetical protein